MKIISFRNLLLQTPSLRYVQLSDVGSNRVCSVPRIWINYESGYFRFPEKNVNAEKLVKTANQVDKSWPHFYIRTIFSECGNYNPI